MCSPNQTLPTLPAVENPEDSPPQCDSTEHTDGFLTSPSVPDSSLLLNHLPTLKQIKHHVLLTGIISKSFNFVRSDFHSVQKIDFPWGLDFMDEVVQCQLFTEKYEYVHTTKTPKIKP